MNNSDENHYYLSSIVPSNTIFYMLYFSQKQMTIDSLKTRLLSKYTSQCKDSIKIELRRYLEPFLGIWVDADILLDLYACYKNLISIFWSFTPLEIVFINSGESLRIYRLVVVHGIFLSSTIIHENDSKDTILSNGRQ